MIIKVNFIIKNIIVQSTLPNLRKLVIIYIRKDDYKEVIRLQESSSKRKLKSFIYLNRDKSIEELKEEINILNKNKDSQSYNNRLFFELYNSNRIEGNSLTQIDTKLLLEDKILPEDQPYKDIVETLNINRAFKQYKRFDNLSLEHILDIHKTITMDVLKDSECGELRNCSVYIQGSEHIPPKSEEVLEKLEDTINEYNASKKQLEDIFLFKLKFVAIHPFVDGNGRVSRILMNGLLEGKGYPRLIITENERGLYYKYLEIATVKFKSEEWIRYCINLLLYTLTYLKESDILS